MSQDFRQAVAAVTTTPQEPELPPGVPGAQPPKQKKPRKNVFKKMEIDKLTSTPMQEVMAG
jgi:hypothetical protein